MKNLSAVLSMCLAAGVATAAVPNGSFETPGDTMTDPLDTFADWTEGGNLVLGSITQSSVAPTDGSFHMVLAGPNLTDGMGANIQGDTVLDSTRIPASRGDLFTASFDVTTPSSDPSTGSLVVCSLQYFDANGNQLQDLAAVRFDNEMTQDLYEPLSVSGVAPTGTVEAQITIVHVQLTDAGRGGVMYVDNANLDFVSADNLVNGSFEAAGASPLSGWTEFGNGSACCDNVSADAVAARNGNFGLKLFGPFTGPFRTDNYVYQDVPVVPGDFIDVDAWAKNPGDDFIKGTNVGFLEVEWLDGSGTLISAERLPTLDVNSPFDSWTNFLFQPLGAPAGAATARVKIGYDADDIFSGGAIHYDDIIILKNTLEDVTVNGEFEAPAGGIFDSWEQYGPNINSDPIARTGGASFKVFQDFSGATNFSGVLQALPSNPGDEWLARVYHLQTFTDFLLGANVGYLTIEYLDAANNLVLTDMGEVISERVTTGDGFTPLEEWTEATVMGVTPAGATQVRINIGLEGDAAGSGGSIWYDDAELIRTFEAPTGPVACSVADVTTTNTNPGEAGYGVPDGAVDGADLSYFVEQWLGTVAAVADVTTTNTNPGDAGYGVADGSVDGADLSYFVERWLENCP